MTTLPIPPELEAALQTRAQAEGITVDDLVTIALLEVARDVVPIPTEIEESWMQEIQRREERFDSGETTAVSWDDAMRLLHQRTRRRLDAA